MKSWPALEYLTLPSDAIRRGLCRSLAVDVHLPLDECCVVTALRVLQPDYPLDFLLEIQNEDGQISAADFNECSAHSSQAAPALGKRLLHMGVVR